MARILLEIFLVIIKIVICFLPPYLVDFLCRPQQSTTFYDNISGMHIY